MSDFVYKKDDVFSVTAKRNAEQEAMLIFEAAAPQISAEEGFTDSQMRSMGISIALTWIDGGDYTIDVLDGIIFGMADGDADGEISDDENDFYNELYEAVGNAFIALGGNTDNVQAFIDDEDSEAGEKLGKFLSDKISASEVSEDDLIIKYATSPDMILESTKKVIRGGSVVFKKKRIKKFVMNGAQRAALKKARMKAFTSGAKRKRARSMRIRKKMGL